MIRTTFVGVAMALALGLAGCEGGEKGEINALADRYEKAMKSGDMGVIIDTMPPRLFEVTGKDAGVTAEEAKAGTREAMTMMLAAVKILETDMDTSKATKATTPDGKRTYYLIPTTAVVEIPGIGKTRSTGTTLALEDGGAWRLVRLDGEAQSQMVRELWPEFEGVTFPAATAEPIP